MPRVLGTDPAGAVSGGAALIGLGGAIVDGAVGERADASAGQGVRPGGKAVVEPADAARGVEVGCGVGDDGIIGERSDDGAPRRCVREDGGNREHGNSVRAHCHSCKS